MFLNMKKRLKLFLLFLKRKRIFIAKIQIKFISPKIKKNNLFLVLISFFHFVQKFAVVAYFLSDLCTCLFNFFLNLKNITTILSSIIHLMFILLYKVTQQSILLSKLFLSHFYTILQDNVRQDYCLFFITTQVKKYQILT